MVLPACPVNRLGRKKSKPGIELSCRAMGPGDNYILLTFWLFLWII